MQFINNLLDSTSVPFITAFLIGILTSISPCPLATNISAVAYISKQVAATKKTLLNGLFYTLGRMASYTLLSFLISAGVSSFAIASIFQTWGDKVLGPVLIVLGLIMLDVIKLNLKMNNDRLAAVKESLSHQGYWGSFALGALFALAFCPYSGVLFFGVLIPLIATSPSSLLLAPIFGFATGLPVILFSALLVISMKRFAQLFKLTQKLELYVRKLVAAVFLLTGLYYFQFLIRYIMALLS